jgi:hypothetical protein
VFEQLDHQGLADSAPHVYRVNVYYLDPTALVYTETAGHGFAADESDLFMILLTIRAGLEVESGSFDSYILVTI